MRRCGQIRQCARAAGRVFVGSWDEHLYALDAASLREGLRSCLVPEGFRYAADEELDFGVCSDDDPLSRCLAGAPAEAKDRIHTNIDGASIEIARVGPRRYTATDAAGVSLEVVRLFESALYVK